jgi:hypothetical protein
MNKMLNVRSRRVLNYRNLDLIILKNTNLKDLFFDMKPYSKSKHNPLLKKLESLFKANPDKSTIVLKEKCSGCGGETIIEITPTSGGFGLQGGALFNYSNGKYIAKCLACYEKTLK